MEEPTKARILYNELIAENAMTDEAIRFVRKSWRGNNQGSVIANIIIVSMIGLVYIWTMVAMVRADLTLTLPIEYAELIAVTLLAPAAIYSAISGEREKATWDALVLTRLTAAQIIAGKLAWRIAVLLGVMAIMLMLVFVSQTQGLKSDRLTASAVLVGQLLILTWGIFLTAFGLWISARTSKGVTSIGVILTAMIGSLLMLPALLSAFGANMNLNTTWTNAWTMLDVMGIAAISINPFILLEGTSGGNSLLSERGWIMTVSALYLLATAFFVWRTHYTLRRLSAD